MVQSDSNNLQFATTRAIMRANASKRVLKSSHVAPAVIIRLVHELESDCSNKRMQRCLGVEINSGTDVRLQPIADI